MALSRVSPSDLPAEARGDQRNSVTLGFKRLAEDGHLHIAQGESVIDCMGKMKAAEAAKQMVIVEGIRKGRIANRLAIELAMRSRDPDLYHATVDSLPRLRKKR